MVVENEVFEFFITNVETDNQFLEIWAQTDMKLAQTITTVMLPLQEKFDYFPPSNIPPYSLAPHTLCCAKRYNNEYARVRVITVRTDGMVLVRFVDYGNIISVPLHNIRLIDNIPEAKCLFSLPEAATSFVLADIVPIGGTWLESVISKIKAILINNKYCGVYKNFNNYKVIKFSVINQDFSQMLVNRNMAVYSQSWASNIPQILPSSIPAQPIRTTTQPPSENWRMPVHQNVTPVQKVVKTNSFKAIQLDIGSVHDVNISYVEEGPCKFSVQLTDSISYLNNMMEKINTQNHLPLQEPPIAGSVCLGKQSHTNRLCRVILNSPGDTSCKVYYADYGHHEVLPFTSIFQIPDEFVIPNIFSIRFTLSGIMHWNVTSEMKDYFGGLVLNQSLKLRVCKGPLSPFTQYCELFLHGKDVKELLSAAFPDCCDCIYDKPKQLCSGMKETVIVSFVDSVTKFFVQIERDTKLLFKVMDQIEQISKVAAKLTSGIIYPNMPCLALYDVDKKWYRASVLSLVNADKVQVFYVDFGNEETISINNLRVIPLEIIKALPPQAIKCSLNGFKSDPGDIEMTNIFENLVLEERLNLVVVNNLQNTAIVDLLDSRNSSDYIAEKLRILRQEVMANSDGKKTDTFKPLQLKNQKCDEKVQTPLVQKQRAKNKNMKTRDSNWSGTWEEKASNKQSNHEPYEASKSKFRKDNENEQRHDNRFRKGNSEYANGPQNRDGARPERLNPNDRFNRRGPDDFRSGKENANNKTNVNSRFEKNLDKSGSDKDSDTSSRGSGRRNNRGERRVIDEQRKRDVPPNTRNRIGRWENEEQHQKNYNADTNSNFNKSRSSKSTSEFDKSNSSNWSLPISKMPSTLHNDLSKLTSTPIAKIPPPNITIGAVKKCVMVVFDDPTNFYIQLCPDNDELMIIMEKINDIYEKGGKVLQRFEVKENLQCIAQYSADEQWYRAEIKSIENSSATVYFLDYGNVETVSFDKIKEIEPTFVKLAAQAVHCKLFCPSKNEWSQKESAILCDKITDQPLEAEFVVQENGVYQILLKEAKPDVKNYINSLFDSKIDFVKEKEAVRNKLKGLPISEKIIPDYAALSEKWRENKLDLGVKYEVLPTWFINPEAFYCQLASEQQKFRDMMNEIQIVYAGRQHVSEPLKVGSSVIAVLPDDGVLYRAEILELNKPRGHVVQYVDYGDRGMVDARRIYPVEKKYMNLPKQAIFCGLKNIAPASGVNWSNTAEMSKLFNAEKFDCIFHELNNDKYLVSLKDKDVDVASALVDTNMAVFSSVATDKITNGLSEETIQLQNVPRIDVNLLEGQTLYVKVSSVEGVSKFYIQFHMADSCQEIIDNYMASKNENRQMLALPGNLSVMQNQAIECALFDVPVSAKADETLKKIVSGKDVKMFVEKVESNRLIVRLFDINGNKIKVIDTQNTEKISPICSMQILNSTHDVILTFMNNSNSIWLQRINDSSKEEQLLTLMNKHYSKATGKLEKLPEENEVYAGAGQDENWYRVKVTKVKETCATVILIDYGNVEDIAFEKLQSLDSRFYFPHQLAIEVSLTTTLSGSNNEQLDILLPLIEDKTLTATFYNVNRKWVAELTVDGEKLSEKLASLNIAQETTKPQLLEYPEPSEMVVGEKYDVIVSHADDPSQMWLQRREDLPAIENLQIQLQEAATHSLKLDDGIPEVKSLCLASYSFDNQWYRAEVLDADAEITTVRFIDFGNTDVIENNRNSIKQLPERWRSIRRYAIPCKLDVLPVHAAEWSDEACSWLRKVVRNVQLQALMITDKVPICVDLFANGQSISAMLVKEQHATEEEVEDQIDEDVQLDPRSAFTSHVVSIDQFWMQEEKSVDELEMLESRLLMASMLPQLVEIKEGHMCIAQFTDRSYYRAIILSHGEEGVKVRFIDYGNWAISNDIREIPEDLLKIPPLSRKCRLAKPDGIDEWPTGINEEFKKLTNDGATIFILDVLEESEVSLVRLTLNDKDVATELLQLCITKTDEGIVVEERPTPVGEETILDSGICTVSYINSPAEFWIQKMSHYNDLNNIIDELEKAESFEHVSEIQEGKILAAKFDEDGSWYRSKVLSHGEKGTEVFYIDYGNSAHVENESGLRELPEILLQFPVLSTRCSLRLPQGIETWSNLACEKFIQLNDSVHEFQYKLLDDTGLIELLNKNEDIVKTIMKIDDCYEEMNDKNLSADSAIQSEIEHHQDSSNIPDNKVVSGNTDEQDNTIHNNTDEEKIVLNNVDEEKIVSDNVDEEKIVSDNVDEEIVVHDEDEKTPATKLQNSGNYEPLTLLVDKNIEIVQNIESETPKIENNTGAVRLEESVKDKEDIPKFAE